MILPKFSNTPHFSHLANTRRRKPGENLYLIGSCLSCLRLLSVWTTSLAKVFVWTSSLASSLQDWSLCTLFTAAWKATNVQQQRIFGGFQLPSERINCYTTATTTAGAISVHKYAIHVKRALCQSPKKCFWSSKIWIIQKQYWWQDDRFSSK